MRKTSKSFSRKKLVQSAMGVLVCTVLVKLLIYVGNSEAYKNSIGLFSLLVGLIVAAFIFTISQFISSNKFLSKTIIYNALRPAQASNRGRANIGSLLKSVDNPPAPVSRARKLGSRLFLLFLLVFGLLLVIFSDNEFVQANAVWLAVGMLLIFFIYLNATSDFSTME